jgi:serine/threonine protein kinase
MQLGGYRLGALLGRGGFGAVYRATCLTTSRPVAVKVLDRAEPDALQRFAREARILYEHLDNRYIVDLLDHNLSHGPPYIVLELCIGGSLRPWVAHRQRWQRVAYALLCATQGLRGIHDDGGYHRDVKPDNLLISGDVATRHWVVKVADFGLARALDSTSPHTRGPRGTEGYIAPEVLSGAPFSSAADMYSLGVVATELLTGTRGVAALAAMRGPAPLRAVVTRMLSPVPSVRPTAAAVGELLHQVLNQPSRTDSPAPRQGSPSDTPGSSAFGWIISGAAVLGALALAGSETKWDTHVQRHRGPDGRFST